MPCKEIEKKLIRFIDLELPLKEMSDVKLHIKECTHCSRLASQIGTPPDFSPLFNDGRGENFWHEFDTTLFKKLEERKKESNVIRLFRSGTPRKMALAASLVILLLIPLLFLQKGNDIDSLRLPSPKTQGVSFSLSPVRLNTESLEFATDPAAQTTERYNHAPILENVDYRRDTQNGFY